MLTKTTTWFCDRCGEPIENPDEGLVEWIDRIVEGQPGARRRRGLRIVHNGAPKISKTAGGCPYQTHEAPTGMGFERLDYMIGQDGLMRLLEMLSLNHFEDREEVFEMIKRLQIAGYEAIRGHINEAYADNVIEQRGERRYLLADEIEQIREAYSGDREDPDED